MKKYAAAVNCIDGRVQEPVIRYLKKNFGVDYVDMITESGPDKVIAENAEKFRVNSIKQRLEVSVRQRGVKVILVAGHEHCSGNPVSKDKHIAHILNAAATVRNWFPGVEIIPAWIDGQWKVEPL